MRLPRIAPLKSALLSIRVRGRVVIARRARLIVHRTGRIRFAPGARLVIGITGDHPRDAVVHVNKRGELQVEGTVHIHRGSYADVGASARLSIGAQTRLTDGAQVFSHRLVTIGRDCSIGWDSLVTDGPARAPRELPTLLATSPVVIADGCRIGPDARVLAGSVLPPHSVVAPGMTLQPVPPGTPVVPAPRSSISLPEPVETAEPQ